MYARNVEEIQQTEFTHWKLAIFQDDALWMGSTRICFFFLKRVIASSREIVHVWFSAPWYGLGEPIRKAPLICDGGSEPILETLLRISITLSRIDRANNDHYPTKPHYLLQLESLLKCSTSSFVSCRNFSHLNLPFYKLFLFLRSSICPFFLFLLKQCPELDWNHDTEIQTFIWANSTTLKSRQPA